MQQQERFAVGMIGFALELDLEFRTHFLEKVCGVSELSTSDDWEILVEPDNWGDLVLKCRTRKFLLVAEFKIGVKLRDHQNPSKPRFNLPSRNGECAGYGWEIGRIMAKENWDNSRYMTVEKKASWSQSEAAMGRISCFPAEWKEFLRPVLSAESKLEAGVYDCLGRFGITVFVARRMKNMNVATHATQPLAVLIGALSAFGVDFRHKLLKDVNHEAFGFNIESEDFPRISRLTSPPGKIAGWFGYESSQPLGPRLSVWLYCFGADEKIKPAAQKRIEAALLNSGINRKQVKDDGASVNVFCMAEESSGDMEWFIKVLTALDN